MSAIRHRWTADDVRQLIDESRAWPRYELIDGELIVTPAPGSPHQFAILELVLLIAPYAEREKLGLTVTSPADLQLRENTISQPDVFVIALQPGAREHAMNWSDVSELVLSVEVISPSSEHTDRVTKRDHYMKSKVAEYWVVDVESRLVERWLPERETPLVTRTTLEWRPDGAAASLRIDLAELFTRVWNKARSIPR